MTPAPTYFTAHLREIDEATGGIFHANYFVMLLASVL